MKQFWQILNILSVAFALIMNFLVGAQILDVASIGEVSDRYATLLTPATYAFSIWSLIYLLLVVFVIYQARDLFSSNSDNTLPQKVGPYFVFANIGNALWTYVFVSDLIGLSTVILLAMVAALFIVLYKLNIATYDAPLRTIMFVWWPLMLYTGWVTVASVVNIASWLASLGITIGPFAAFAILIVLCNVLLILLYLRNLRELILASTWGVAAIGVQLVQDNGSLVVTTTAFTASAILLIAAATHGYANRNSNALRYIKELV